MTTPAGTDGDWLRRAFAQAARACGGRPFGAAVVADGAVLAEAGGEQAASAGGTLAHSEMVALRRLHERAISRALLARATIHSCQIPRIVTDPPLRACEKIEFAP